MGIFITGAARFIGSHLVDRLLEENHTVVGLDNLRNGKQAKSNFSFIKVDIFSRSDVKGAMAQVDMVRHLACLGIRHSIHSPFENHRVNVEGTHIVLIQPP